MLRFPPATVVDPWSSSPCRRCVDGHCSGFIQHRTWRDVCRRCRCDRQWHIDLTNPENHIYENPSDYASVAYSAMSTLSSEGGDAGVGSLGNQTLSSMDGDCGGSTMGTHRGCLSPSTKLHLAADAHRQSTSDDDSGCALEEYVWIPSGLRPDLVHQYFNSLPENKVAYVNSVGEKWRMKELLLQLPPQDSDTRYCRHLSPPEQKELKSFAQQRKREALGRGTVKVVPYCLEGSLCVQCSKQVYSGDLGVFASKAGDQVVWHPSCFACHTCNELLVDLLYFYKDSNVYCGRHHAELTKPRCAACDELIFADECTEAENRSWHLHHFSCFECDKSLGGTRYVMREDRPYCLQCFDEHFAELCASCKKPISNDDARMSHGQRQWHATNQCFSCTVCHAGLLGEPFLPRDDGIFCSLNCSRNKSAAHSAMAINKKSRSRSVTSRSRKSKLTPSEAAFKTAADAAKKNVNDESDYESISPRLHRMNLGRCTSKQQTKTKKCSPPNTEIMARSTVAESRLDDTQSLLSHLSLPDLFESHLNLKTHGVAKQEHKTQNSSQGGVITKMVEKKETTFGVVEPLTPTIRTVRFTSSSKQHIYDNSDECSKIRGYMSTSSSSSDDDDGFYYSPSTNSQASKRERVKYVESKGQNFINSSTLNRTKTSKRGKIKSGNNCIVS